jgi:hypothetical protein
MTGGRHPPAGPDTARRSAEFCGACWPPRPRMIHVSTVAARAPTASLRDGASATLAPTAPTSNAARTRRTGGVRVRARDCPATGPVRNGAPGWPLCACCSPWSRADSRPAVWILRKDLCHPDGSRCGPNAFGEQFGQQFAAVRRGSASGRLRSSPGDRLISNQAERRSPCLVMRRSGVRLPKAAPSWRPL